MRVVAGAYGFAGSGDPDRARLNTARIMGRPGGVRPGLGTGRGGTKKVKGDGRLSDIFSS